MARLTNKELQAEFQELVTKFPTNHPVRLQRVDLKSIWGDCDLIGKKNKYYRIRIDKNLDQCATLCILYHEYAHALAWPLENLSVRDHDDLWGITLAKIWSVMVDRKRLH